MKPFFDEVRARFKIKLNQKQVDCLSALVSASEGLSTKHRAYILATAWHETWCFKYTREIWGPTKQQLKYEPPHKIASDLGNTEKGDGKRFMGRGFPQLTGRRNYVWASKVTGLDLLSTPELAEAPQISAKIIVAGMTTGAFTGKKLSDFDDVKPPLVPYREMRRTVNGTDKAKLIAGYAVIFEKALNAMVDG